MIWAFGDILSGLSDATVSQLGFIGVVIVALAGALIVSVVYFVRKVDKMQTDYDRRLGDLQNSKDAELKAEVEKRMALQDKRLEDAIKYQEALRRPLEVQSDFIQRLYDAARVNQQDPK